MSTEAINNNLNILIDPTFTNVNRLCFSISKCSEYTIVLAFFDLPLKTEEEASEKVIDIS